MVGTNHVVVIVVLIDDVFVKEGHNDGSFSIISV